MGAGMHSVPTGSANSLFTNDDVGISPDDTVGKDDCGPKDRNTPSDHDPPDTKDKMCSIVASAKSNALRSDDLHWTGNCVSPSIFYLCAR